ncbi:MAG: Rab family GTPase [Candidatus Hodarchaeota archaeon]
MQRRSRFCKITLLGDGAVGKTALRERYLGKGFSGSYTMTIGADFASKRQLVDNENLIFQIWDLAGQPRFESVRDIYYKGATGALLVYDITRRESFENLNVWLNELWSNNGKGKVPVVILGNKHDLRTTGDPTQVSYETAMELIENLSEKTKEAGFSLSYFGTSALTGKNVTEAFEELGRKIIKYAEDRKKEKKDKG